MLDTDLGPVEKTIEKTVICLQRGELTTLEADAIVYYASEDLALGPGHGRAIQSRGGPTIQKELEGIGRVAMGKVVATAAGNLPARIIIHACGPKFQEPETEKKLYDCVLAAIFRADALHLDSIAFPPMGAGYYGAPLDFSADVMFSAIEAAIRDGVGLKRIIICVTDRREFAAFEKRMRRL